MCVDPEFVRVPNDDFVTTVARDIQNSVARVGMAVVRESDNGAAPSVEHAAPAHVRIVDEEFDSIPTPVYRETHAAKGIRFAIVVYVAVRVVEMQNPLVAPEVDGDGLETGKIVPEFRDCRVLTVSDPMMLEDVPVEVRYDHRFAGLHEAEEPAFLKPGSCNR